MSRHLLLIIRNLVLVAIGALLLAISINMVIIPNNMGEGGVTGVTVLLYYLFSIPPGWSNLVINSAIIALAYKLLDRKTIIYTLIATVLLTLYLNYLPIPTFVPENKIVAAITAGTLTGSGVGLTLLGGGSTAGTDLIALMINKFTSLSVSQALLMCDTLVVMTLFFVIGPEMWVITLLVLVITSRVINFIVEGLNPQKQLMIISDQFENIGNRIIKEIDRGVTVFKGYGFYSKASKDVLYVIIDSRQLLKTQRLVYDVDPKAFVIISSVQQVLGEGFKLFLEEE